MYEIKCSKCGINIKTDEGYVLCPECHSKLSFNYNYKNYKKRNLQGIWKYIDLLPVDSYHDLISHNEGDTPLVYLDNLSQKYNIKLYVKDETKNPTGSFKDRSAALSTTKALELKKDMVAIGSGGNAASAASAYSAVAGIPCYVFLPETTPLDRIVQSTIYGAEVFKVKGSINDAINIVQKYKEKFNWFDLTTSKVNNPYQGEAIKTIAYEICEQIDWKIPDWIITPVGGGGILSQIWKGLKEFESLNLINRLPKMVGVQPSGCAPLVKAFNENKQPDQIERWAKKPNSIAVTIADVFPLDGDDALQAIYESNGVALDISDDKILIAQNELSSKEAVFAEPAGAAPFAAVKELIDKDIILENEEVLFVATGDGLKDIVTVTKNSNKLDTMIHEYESNNIYEIIKKVNN